MTTTKPITVAGMRAALAEYDAADKEYEQSLMPDTRDRDRTQLIQNVIDVKQYIGMYAPDYLRALLPVVEAAAELEALQDEINIDMSDKAERVWNALIEAVRSLK